MTTDREQWEITFGVGPSLLDPSRNEFHAFLVNEKGEPMDTTYSHDFKGLAQDVEFWVRTTLERTCESAGNE